MAPLVSTETEKCLFLLVNTLEEQIINWHYHGRLLLLPWHYLEVGHGKGAADGVGGCLKRTADSLVAKGVDIPNLEVLVEQMNTHCPNILT